MYNLGYIQLQLYGCGLDDEIMIRSHTINDTQ